MKHDIDFGIICMVLGYNTQYYTELEHISFTEMLDVADYIYKEYLNSDPKQYQYASEFAFDYIHKTLTPTEEN
jgi:hypothetical protein